MNDDHPNDDTLQGLAEGTLPKERIPDLERHLEACDACRESLAGYRALFAALETQPPTPEDLYDGIMASVAKAERNRVPVRRASPGRERWKAVAAGAAAAALLAGLVFFVDRDRALEALAPLPGAVTERVSLEVPLPQGFDQAAGDVMAWAQDSLERTSSRGALLETHAGFSLPLAIGLLLAVLLNAAALVTLRRDAEARRPARGRTGASNIGGVR